MYHLDTRKSNIINSFKNYLVLKHTYIICIKPFCVFGSYTQLTNILSNQNNLQYLTESILQICREKMAMLVAPKEVEICRIGEKMNAEHF